MGSMINTKLADRTEALYSICPLRCKICAVLVLVLLDGIGENLSRYFWDVQYVELTITTLGFQIMVGIQYLPFLISFVASYLPYYLSRKYSKIK